MDELFDELVALWTGLFRLEEGTARRVLGRFVKLEGRLRRLLQDALGSEDAAVTARMKAAEALFKRAKALFADTYGKAEKDLRNAMRGLAVFAVEAFPDAMNKAFRASLMRVATTKAEAKALADATLIRGGPATAWWNKQSLDSQQRFATTVRVGIIENKTNEQIVREVMGEPTGRVIAVTERVKAKDGTTKEKTTRVKETKGGALSATRKQADALVRTAVQTVANKTLLETYAGNEDVVRGVEAIVTLDNRTTHLCISRSGARWSLDGTPLPDSNRDEPFPGPPPWHFKCRTTLAPLTYTWAELVERATGKQRAVAEKELPVETRAAMGGELPANTTYDGWLRRQSEATQRDILGDGRWSLWSSGKIKLAQLTDASGRSLTLKELRASRNLP